MLVLITSFVMFELRKVKTKGRLSVEINMIHIVFYGILHQELITILFMYSISPLNDFQVAQKAYLRDG